MSRNATPSSSRQVVRTSEAGPSKTPGVSLARQVVLDVSHGSPSSRVLPYPHADPSLPVVNDINRKMNIRPLYLISSNGTFSLRSLGSQRPTLTYQLLNHKIPKRSPRPSGTSPLSARMLQDRVRPGWKGRDGAGKPSWRNITGRRIFPGRRLEERI
jgi:hypothetical protein